MVLRESRESGVRVRVPGVPELERVEETHEASDSENV